MSNSLAQIFLAEGYILHYIALVTLLIYSYSYTSLLKVMPVLEGLSRDELLPRCLSSACLKAVVKRKLMRVLTDHTSASG